jgi:type IV pilus assembly protein PilW
MEIKRIIGNSSGVTLPEFLVSSLIFLIIAIAAYGALDYGKRTYASCKELTRMQKDGRAALELMTSEIRMAGYNPRGVPLTPLPTATATTLRLLADLNGDGIVGTSTQPNENITYRFLDLDGDGIGQIERGADFNGDGDFNDPGEYVETIADYIQRADMNGDGVLEDFFRYDTATPNTRKVTIAFVARSMFRNTVTHQYETLKLQSTSQLRNVSPHL